MRQEHLVGGGRPLITVSEDYSTLTNPSIVVQNSGGGPAKDISFEFSASIKSSYGFVVSDLPLFKEGLPSLCRKIVKALRQETGKGEAARLFRVSVSPVKRYARMACKGSPFVPKKEPRQKRTPGKRGKPTAGQLLCRRWAVRGYPWSVFGIPDVILDDQYPCSPTSTSGSST